MTRYAYRYPDGATGFALLLLRVSHVFVAIGVAAALSATSAGVSLFHLAAVVIAVFLTIGFATRWAALLLGVGVVVAMIGADASDRLLLAGHIGGCAAIGLIGAGAFSIDALRYGRRVIQLQTDTPDRGSGG